MFRQTLLGCAANLLIKLEPEAAALLCFQHLTAANVDHKAAYMVVDIGGGTMDIVVRGWDEKDAKNTGLKELISGDGGLAAGSYIDSAFFRYLGRIIPGWKEFAKAMPNEAQRMRSLWEGAKVAFTGIVKVIAIDLPSKLAAAIRACRPDSTDVADDDDT